MEMKRFFRKTEDGKAFLPKGNGKWPRGKRAPQAPWTAAALLPL
jgi:hypothetical protein